MQNRPEGCIFQHSCTQRFTKSGTVSLGRKLARVPVTMLWVGTSSPNIHKIIKGSNLSFEMSDDKGHNLSWRFIYFRKSRDEIFMARDSVIFLLQHLGFAINLKKCVRCCTRNGVLRVDWEFPNYDFVITREKDSEDKGSVPEFVQSSRGITSEVSLFSTIQAVLPAHLQFRLLQQQQILSLKQTQSYLTLVKLTPMAKNELQ